MRNGNKAALLKIALIVIVVMGLFLYLTNVSGLLFEYIPDDEFAAEILPDIRKSVKECLPISPTNPLYVDPSSAQEKRSALMREVNNYVQRNMLEKNMPKAHELLDIYEKYYDDVGANGIFDVYALVSGQLESHSSHSIGEFLADKSDGQYLDLVEILACNINIGAALHGLIWTALSNETDEGIYSKSRELCYFKNVKDMSFVASGCLHGVGHGFFMKFDDDPREAYDRCNLFEDREFAYRCGSGVAMSVSEARMKPKSYKECRYSALPVFCYDTVYPRHNCSNLEDTTRHNRIGCAWAYGHNSHNSTLCDDAFLTPFPDEFDTNLYHACLAGLFAKRPTSCKPFKEDKDIFNLCKHANTYHTDMSNAYIKDPESNKYTVFNHLILDLYIEEFNGLCCLF